MAQRFYFEFIPEAQALAGNDAEINKVINDLLDQAEHSWRKGLSPEERQKILDFLQATLRPIASL